MQYQFLAQHQASWQCTVGAPLRHGFYSGSTVAAIDRELRRSLAL